jgi:glycosyltransferase involved in cell wall biosynthesis
VALVHDWLTGMRGGEKVLEDLCVLFPEADVFTLVHVPGSVSATIERRTVRTSFLQRLPWAAKRYRHYLPLMPWAAEALDLRGYDLVVSSSHCVAKGVRPAPGAVHVCFCHTPMRYIWDQYDAYFAPGRAPLLTRLAMALARRPLQRWDVSSSRRVDAFIANSRYVADRIRRFYGRDARVVHPGVDLDRYPAVGARDDGFYLLVTALVPYKRADAAVLAFNGLGLPLRVIGSGPEERRLRSLAGPGVEFLGWADDEALRRNYESCRALIFPGEEDFGIVPLEAMACGKPVIALGRGGALETVVAPGDPGGRAATGLFFDDPDPRALADAVRRFEASRGSFDARRIREHALTFGRDRFRRELKAAVMDEFGRREGAAGEAS